MSGVGQETLPLTEIRADFPILERHVRGRPLVYLDNASTTQKPRAVIEAVEGFYAGCNSNVHRGVHTLSQEATEAYEGARRTVCRFLGAGPAYEAVFTRGTTEAVNLVARTWGRRHLSEGDEVLVTEMEHHSNIVPWQMICRETGAELRVLPVTDGGDLDLDRLDEFIGDRTRLVAVIHMSNVLGTVNTLEPLVEAARRHGARILVDGAQAAAHLPVSLDDLDADFYAFSGHKVYGPTGIGALVARRALLEEMPPWQGGGDMIKSVSFDGTVYNDVPWKFEAGTPNIAGAVGLAAALDYLSDLGLEAVDRHEGLLVEAALAALEEIPGLRVVGSPQRRSGAVSFVMQGAHPHDIGTILDMQGVAIRTGHHCAEPLMTRLGLPATARASFGLYNTLEEAEALATALGEVAEVFG